MTDTLTWDAAGNREAGGRGASATPPDATSTATAGRPGWTNGVPGYGHDGASIGQYAYLRVAPQAGVAICAPTAAVPARCTPR
ncbi:hypothetical protein [Actinomadura sp. WMMB 499]|uniref:hypothetical protein n=1 Tax=Actinomadura sp. WMMB 499 TaxID=1219491 RepID=UPI001C3F64E6|nr:hypothetical protein [Actinomadura sp. WMMB 499]